MNNTGISYELAKKLQDADFPQKEVHIDQKDKWISVNGNFYDENWCYVPTLSELIEACGDEFQKLEKYGTKEKNNIKFESTGGWDEDGSYKFYTNGSTPEESVANLYISLKQ